MQNVKPCLFLLILVVVFGCSKKEGAGQGVVPPPPVPGLNFTSIATAGVQRTKIFLNAAFSIANNPVIISSGFCLGKTSGPTLLNFYKRTSTSLQGTTITDSITGLNYKTTYYVRAYAIINAAKPDTVYSAESTVATVATALIPTNTVYGGGLVFYVDSTGEHGLIIAKNDIGRFMWLNCGNRTAIIGTSGSIGTGQSNTNLILGHVFTNPPCPFNDPIAAKVCDDYSFAGYNDWYLPSLQELYAFQDFCFQNGQAAPYWLGMDLYWSSSGSSNGNYAYAVPGTNAGASTGSWSKDEYFSVRAIRSF
jgi:hypothetical protein